MIAVLGLGGLLVGAGAPAPAASAVVAPAPAASAVVAPAAVAPAVVAPAVVAPAVVAPAVGTVFVADAKNSRVVAFLPDGRAGAVGTGLRSPQGVALDAAGDLFVADTGADRVVRIQAGGGAQTGVGTGLKAPAGVAVDGAGDVYVADTGNNRVLRITSGGQTTVGAGLIAPRGVAVGAAGDVWIADTGNNRVLRVAAGRQTTLRNLLFAPAGVAADTAGYVYVADTGNNRVLKMVATTGTQIPVGTGLHAPTGVAVDAAGGIHVADADGLATVPRTGPQQTVAAGLRVARGVAVYAPPPSFRRANAPGARYGHPYSYRYTAATPAGEPPATFAVATGHLPPGLTLGRATGILAGTPMRRGTFTFTVEAANAAAGTLSRPQSIAVTGQVPGDLYVADPARNRVVLVPADGGPQRSVGTGLSGPQAVAVNAAGDLVIADTGNDRVVEVPADGGPEITVGTGLKDPTSVAVDSAGRIVVADTGNDRLVRVLPDGGPQTTVYTGRLISLGRGAGWYGFAPSLISVDVAGNIIGVDNGDYDGEYGYSMLVRIAADGSGWSHIEDATFIWDHDLAVDAGGSPYFASGYYGNDSVWAEGTGTAYSLAGEDAAQGLAVDAAGTLDVHTFGGRVIRIPAGGGDWTRVGTDLGGSGGLAVYAPPPTFLAAVPPTMATVGRPYAYRYRAAVPTGETIARFTLTSGQLPPGLALDPATGILAGSPTTAGTYTFVAATENAATGALAPRRTIVVMPA